MSIGSRITVRASVTGLPRGEYFRCGGGDEWIRLVSFERQLHKDGRTGTLRATERMISRVLFEQLLSEHEAVIENQADCPWVDSISRTTQSDRVKQKSARLKELRDELTDQINCDLPLVPTLNNRYRAMPSPRPSLASFRKDFFAFAVFGEQGIQYRGGLIGRWDRYSKERRLLGRRSPSTESPFGGRNTTRADLEAIERIVRASGRDSDGMWKPFTAFLADCEQRGVRPLTKECFYYHAKRIVGKELLRPEQPAPKLPGARSNRNSCFRFGERFEFDSQQIEMPPALPDGTGEAKKVWVTLAVDVLTGLDAGIGFSDGAEQGQSYRDALFCAAVDKVEFCRVLFGKKISPSDWPSRGVPASSLMDRGAGSGVGAILPDSQLTPTARPNSKGAVETSHKKRTRLNERFEHRRTTLTRFELMLTAIDQLICQNKSKDVREAVVMDLREVVEVAVPNNYHAALIERGRDATTQMSLEAAARCFLQSRAAFLEGGMAKYGAFRWLPVNEDDCQTLLKAPHRAKASIYIYSGSARACWLDFDGQWMELSLALSTSYTNGDLCVSLHQLDRFAAAQPVAGRALRDQRALAHQAMAKGQKESIGSQPTSYVQSGRPKSAKKLVVGNQLR